MQPYWYCEWAREGWMADQKPEDHYIESGPYYLASEVDARIAELEKALRQTDCKCRQASETPYFYVPVVSYKCPRCAALSL